MLMMNTQQSDALPTASSTHLNAHDETITKPQFSIRMKQDNVMSA